MPTIKDVFPSQVHQKLLSKWGYDNVEADINILHPATNSSILHDAVINNAIDIVELLVARKNIDVDINKPDEDGNMFHVGKTPVLLAMFYGHRNILKFLLEQGADPNKSQLDGKTPLMFAAIRGDEDALIWLLEKGAHINQENPIDRNLYDMTALMYATWAGKLSAAKILIDHSAAMKNSQGFLFTDYAPSETFSQSISDYMLKCTNCGISVTVPSLTPATTTVSSHPIDEKLDKQMLSTDNLLSKLTTHEEIKKIDSPQEIVKEPLLNVTETSAQHSKEIYKVTVPNKKVRNFSLFKTGSVTNKSFIVPTTSNVDTVNMTTEKNKQISNSNNVIIQPKPTYASVVKRGEQGFIPEKSKSSVLTHR